MRGSELVLACRDHHGAVHAASPLGIAGRLGAFASAGLGLGADLSAEQDIAAILKERVDVGRETTGLVAALLDGDRRSVFALRAVRF